MRSFFSHLFGSADESTCPAPTTRLAVEALELRTTPTILFQTVSVHDGDIYIRQTTGNDAAQVSQLSGIYRVVANGKVTDISAAKVTGGDVFYYGGAGNDSFANLTHLRAFAYGENGDDELRGGSNNDYLHGGAGNDRLLGNGGDDTLEGFSGTDLAYGGAGDDTLYGSTDNDTLYGEAGNDTIYGEHGKDTLDGGTGNDTLDGGADWDYLYGRDGDDALYGGADWDSLDGGSGNDYLDGGVGADFDALRGGTGSDRFVYDHYTKGYLGWKTHHNRDAPADFTLEDQIVYPNLDSAVNLAFTGQSSISKVAGHQFNLGPITFQRTADGVKAEGSFQHKIDGPNDTVHFSVTVKKGQTPVAEITHIQYGGIASSKVFVGIEWAVRIGGKIAGVVGGKYGKAIEKGAEAAAAKMPAILKGIDAIQRWLIGNWEPSAVAVVDAIAVRLMQEV